MTLELSGFLTIFISIRKNEIFDAFLPVKMGDLTVVKSHCSRRGLNTNLHVKKECVTEVKKEEKGGKG